MTDLIYQSLGNDLTDDEQSQLDAWLNKSVKRRVWYQNLTADGLHEAMQRGTIERTLIVSNIHECIRKATGISSNRTEILLGDATTKVVRPVYKLRPTWWRYAAAIIIFLGVGFYIWPDNTKEVKTAVMQALPVSKDIQPGGQRAILQLAGGKVIILDSAADGQLASENGSDVVKKDGQIIYNARQLHNNAPTFNTMTTPKGGQYQLKLIDGTKVWLNAASSIIYPTVFSDDRREVKITGEAYLEVAKNTSKPFIVKTTTDEITVMGTRFNIYSYPDETMKTSLIDGAVKINQTVLQSGQAYMNGKIITTNIEQDIAWTKGVFNFEDLELPVAMRQLERWYGIDVKYAGKMRAMRFAGGMERSLSLRQVLRILEGINGLHFTLNGQTLTVTL